MVSFAINNLDQHLMEFIFWISLLGVLYAYLLYPVTLYIWGKIRPKPTVSTSSQVIFTPSVSIVMPLHNEAHVVEGKLKNIEGLDYPSEAIDLVIVSDGSTDETVDLVRKYQQSGSKLQINLIEINDRKGKANALNHALSAAREAFLVFTDASIMLEAPALKAIMAPFQDPAVGCVSGEDHIPNGGGEGMYGRYELFLRNQESKIGSIVGASGSFYAQRKQLCVPFVEGMAPDFLSVLCTVEQGYRAVTEPLAIGTMSSTKSNQQEFQRKIRTLVRGLAAIFHKKPLMNPLKYGVFSFILLSHKLARWSVPFFLILLLVSNFFLLDGLFYLIFLFLQVAFYMLAIIAGYVSSAVAKSIFGKIALYFSMVNVAIFIAWIRYFSGFRQEVWEPTKRES